MKTRMRKVMLGAILTILMVATVGHADLNDGLIAYYPFEGNANDASGNDNHGIEYGGVTYVDGVIGQAANFDGYDDAVKIDKLSIDTLIHQDSWSICLWLNPDLSVVQGVLGDDMGNADWSIYTYPLISNRIQIDLRGTESYTDRVQLDSGINSIAPTEWYHLVLMYDSTNYSAELYLNGTLRSSGVLNTPLFDGTANGIALGCSYFYTPVLDGFHPFDGQIDEARIYNRILSQSEIEELADVELPEPDIDVSPTSYDFGNVGIYSATTTFVSIFNTGDGDLTIESLGFSAGGSSNFSITTAPSLPATVAPGANIDVEITFAPSNVYYSGAVLEIGSDDPDESLVTVDLGGIGVVSEKPPSEQVQEIIDFIEDSVSIGELSGEGPGNSADKKLNAMINMIEAAGNLISDGRYDEAQQQLDDILKRCDGQSPPPDFVTGPAAVDLADKIETILESLTSSTAPHFGFKDYFEDPWNDIYSQNCIWMKSGPWYNEFKSEEDPRVYKTYLRPENVSVSGSNLVLTVPSNVVEGAEIKTIDADFYYGYYEAKIKASAQSGVVNAFFVYRETDNKNEIDIEFLSKDFIGDTGKVYFTLQPGNRQIPIKLTFNPAATFHKYGFNWSASSVEFFIDGHLIPGATMSASEGFPVPSLPCKLLLSNWTSATDDGIPGWGGDPPQSPATMEVDWVSFTPEND